MIPPFIHQAWSTEEPAQSQTIRCWIRSWRENEGFSHTIYREVDCAALVAAKFPELAAAYQLLAPVERALLWRYLVLWEQGGVYSDLDTRCVAPIVSWVEPDDELVLAIETDLLDQYPRWKPSHRLASGGALDISQPRIEPPLCFSSRTMAARPHHPLLADVIRRIAINAADPFFSGEMAGWTYKKVGCGALSDATFAHLEMLGCDCARLARALRASHDIRIGGIRFLDCTAFRTRFVERSGVARWIPMSQTIRRWRCARAAAERAEAVGPTMGTVGPSEPPCSDLPPSDNSGGWTGASATPCLKQPSPSRIGLN